MNKEDRIIELFKNGMSVAKIAKEVKMSRQGVYNILIRKKIKYKKDIKNVEIDVLENELKNKKIKDIISETEIPYHQLRKVMKENGLRKSELLNDILKKDIIDRLYNEKGFNDVEIAKIFNCSQHTIRSFRWENNIYSRRRNWQKELTKEHFLELKKKYSLREISEMTNLPYHTIVKANQIYNTKEND